VDQGEQLPGAVEREGMQALPREKSWIRYPGRTCIRGEDDHPMEGQSWCPKTEQMCYS